MQLRERFAALFGHEPEGIYSAAGRVNLIGEHVDYCGGEVLPAALTLKCRVAVRKNGTNALRVAATDLNGVSVIDLNDIEKAKSLKWGNYQAGVASELIKEGFPVVGCDMLFECSVPFGAGLSSSAAIEVSCAYALAKMSNLPLDPVALAVIAQRAENNFCGMKCGIMDQFASANGKRGNAVLLNCATLAYEYIPLDLQDCTLVLTNCNKPHNLVESKYNERREETEEALAILKGVLPVSCLAEVTGEELEAHKALLRPVVYRRVRHVVSECLRVKESVAALKRGDLISFGKLLNASHRSLKEDYEVTGRELDALAEAAWAQAGCLGSRMTGGGFGGCTVSLVKRDCVEAFKAEVGAAYRAATGYEATFYEADIADGIIEEAQP